MSEKAQHYLKHGRIFSANNDGMCGYNFKLGELYLIAASSPNVGICHYVRPYSSMSIVEKRGVAGGYKKGCECTVSYLMFIASLRRRHLDSCQSQFLRCYIATLSLPAVTTLCEASLTHR